MKKKTKNNKNLELKQKIDKKEKINISLETKLARLLSLMIEAMKRSNVKLRIRSSQTNNNNNNDNKQIIKKKVLTLFELNCFFDRLN
jgi:hypothetical protein